MNLFDEYVLYVNKYPWQNIKLGEDVISYRYFGDGKQTILLFIGGSMFTADAYFKLILGLSKKYQILLIEYPKNLDTIEKLIHKVHELINSLNINKLHVIGMNHGGGIAQAFAKYYNQFVLSLTLYNTLTKTANMSEYAKQITKQILEALNQLSELRELMPLSQIKQALLDQIKLSVSDGNDMMLYEHFIDLYQDEDESHHMKLIKDLLTNYSFDPNDFSYLNQKTLLFYGHDQDPLGGTELIETLADLFTNPVLEFVEADRFSIIVNEKEILDKIISFIK